MGKEKPPSPIYLRIKKAFNGAPDVAIARQISEAGGKAGKSAISQWRNGETVPSTDNLLIISKLTGVPLEVLNGEREVDDEGRTEVETASQPMTFDRFVRELRNLGVEDFHSIKSMRGLSPADMEEIIAVAKSNARATAQTMIEKRTKDKK